MKETYQKAEECLNEKYKTIEILKTPKDDYKKAVKECLPDLLESLKKCLTEEEKSWPEFYLLLVENYVDFLYENAEKLTGKYSKTL